MSSFGTIRLSRCDGGYVLRNRFEAEGRDWDVQAVLSENRERFGPKGPLEVRSERLIQEALLGNPQSVYHILRDKKVHPDVGDARGHTALIAATVTHTHTHTPLALSLHQS